MIVRLLWTWRVRLCQQYKRWLIQRVPVLLEFGALPLLTKGRRGLFIVMRVGQLLHQLAASRCLLVAPQGLSHISLTLGFGLWVTVHSCTSRLTQPGNSRIFDLRHAWGKMEMAPKTTSFFFKTWLPGRIEDYQ